MRNLSEFGTDYRLTEEEKNEIFINEIPSELVEILDEQMPHDFIMVITELNSIVAGSRIRRFIRDYAYTRLKAYKYEIHKELA